MVQAQFRNKDPKEGYIDVYWLYDDGGLTLLLPHILTTRYAFVGALLKLPSFVKHVCVHQALFLCKICVVFRPVLAF